MPPAHASPILAPGGRLPKNRGRQNNADNPLLGRGSGSFRVHPKSPAITSGSLIALERNGRSFAGENSGKIIHCQDCDQTRIQTIFGLNVAGIRLLQSGPRRLVGGECSAGSDSRKVGAGSVSTEANEDVEYPAKPPGLIKNRNRRCYCDNSRPFSSFGGKRCSANSSYSLDLAFRRDNDVSSKWRSCYKPRPFLAIMPRRRRRAIEENQTIILSAHRACPDPGPCRYDDVCLPGAKLHSSTRPIR